MPKSSDKEIKEIEQTQEPIRESIEQATVLATKSQKLRSKSLGQDSANS